MATEMLCELPKAILTDNFEDLLENMEFDEELLRELLEEMNEDNIDQTSIIETVVNEVLPVKENNGESSYFLFDHASQLLFDQDKYIQDFNYWISQEIVEMPCSFPGFTFENEMIPFWYMENRVEGEMVDDIAYVELWEK